MAESKSLMRRVTHASFNITRHWQHGTNFMMDRLEKSPAD